MTRAIEKLKARRALLQLQRLNLTQEIVFIEEVLGELQEQPDPRRVCPHGVIEPLYCRECAAEARVAG